MSECIRRITSCSEDELTTLESLEVECFPGEAWSRESIRGFIENPSVLTLVTEADGHIVGMACAIIVCDEAEILKVAVTSAYRRHRIGMRMITEMLHPCLERGVCRLLLEVRESNTAARRLYDSLGFTPYGTRRGYYTSPREDAILMEKHISPISQVTK